MRRRRTERVQLPVHIFLVIAIGILAGDVCLLLLRRQSRWLVFAPIALWLVTLLILGVMHHQQQKNRDALLSKVAELADEMKAERKQYAELSAAKTRQSRLPPPNGHNPSLN